MHQLKQHGLRLLLAILLCCFLSSCMVGPNFKSPCAPRIPHYTNKPIPAKTIATPLAGKSGKSQIFVTNLDLPAKWWQLFHSRKLNHLIEISLVNSPNLTAAMASLRQAQELVNAQIGLSLFPNVSAGLSGMRQKFSGASQGISTNSIFNLYGASVNVTYTLDMFGGARRQIEGLRAQVDNQRYLLVAAYLTLTSNIVTQAINVASFRSQLRATQTLLQMQQGQLDIWRKQYQLGGVAYSSVLSQETLVAQTRATIPPLQKSLAQAEHALAVLTGRTPNVDLPVLTLDDFDLPKTLPISLPSKLIRQRPDIQQSEALLHVASAQIGVATANLFPQINLTGSYGWQTPLIPNLFTPATNVWSYGAQLTQPIFNAGALRAQRRAAIDAFDAAYGQYQQVVLTAFKNVADTLRALQEDAKTLRAQKSAEMIALESLNVTREQYKLGGVNYINVFTANQLYQQAVIARIQAQATRYADTAALFQALGGGWWNCQTEKLHAKS